MHLQMHNIVTNIVKDEMVTFLLMLVTIIAKRFVMDVIKCIGMRFQATGTPDSNKANKVKCICMETTLMWI